MYRTARLDANKETRVEMPVDCPYSVKDILEKLINEK
jgi:hypothetical protein